MNSRKPKDDTPELGALDFKPRVRKIENGYMLTENLRQMHYGHPDDLSAALTKLLADWVHRNRNNRHS